MTYDHVQGFFFGAIFTASVFFLVVMLGRGE